jgi:CheY-like chemotaxis protein
VIEVAYADEALDVLAHISGVSLIISDIQMPGSIDGLGLARSDYPTTRIVLTSRHLPNVDDARKVIDHVKTLLDQKAPMELLIDGR